MRREYDSARRTRRPQKPLDSARIEELAVAYVARFATSAGKLEAYLKRKLRERGWDGEIPPDPAALAARFAERGWVDDAGWGRMRSEGLLARGYGARRIEQALQEGGLAEDLRASLRPDEAAAREAVVALARRRRLGPFGTVPPGEDAAARSKRREKQLAALVRAGHEFALAARIVDAADTEEVARWLEE